MSLKLGILKEPAHENRVSFLPEQASVLIKKGITVYIEKGAGAKASATDHAYESAGATVSERNDVIRDSDVILSIHPFEDIKDHAVVIGVYQPLYEYALMNTWASKISRLSVWI